MKKILDSQLAAKEGEIRARVAGLTIPSSAAKRYFKSSSAKPPGGFMDHRACRKILVERPDGGSKRQQGGSRDAASVVHGNASNLR